MMVEVSVHTLDGVHQSDSVASVRDILKEKGLNFQIGPMGTTIDGDANAIFDALKACSSELLKSHPGYNMTIQVEDRLEDERSLTEAPGEQAEKIQAYQ